MSTTPEQSKQAQVKKKRFSDYFNFDSDKKKLDDKKASEQSKAEVKVDASVTTPSSSAAGEDCPFVFSLRGGPIHSEVLVASAQSEYNSLEIV